MDIYRHTCPFLFLLTALATGILCGNDLNAPFYIFYTVTGLAILSYLLPATRPASPLLLLAALFCCGLTLSQDHKFTPNPSKTYSIQGRCEEKWSADTYILRAYHQRLYLKHHNTNVHYTIGDSLVFPATLQPLHETANDGEFDYNRYLKQQGIDYQVIPQGVIRQTGHSQTVYSYLQSVRSRLLVKTDLLFTDPDVNAMMKALCLGYKNDLNTTTRELFVTSGTIHLLAVSGLHTGAVFILISALFRLSRIYNRKYYLSIIPLLWCYAMITGLSPATVRAATILSFITIGRAFARDYSPINSIAASAFFTLLLSPDTLYTVSFQMSYAAYTGIILLYPVLNRPASDLQPVVARIYSLFCLTIAAQLAVLPVSVFYFHHITVNSFMINLLAIPIATVLLYGGVILLVLPVFIGLHFAFIIRWTGKLLLYLLEKFNALAWNIGDLYPSWFQLLLIYICLAFLYWYLLKRNRISLKGMWISLTLLLGYTCLYNHTLSRQQEVVVFNIPQRTCVLLNQKGYYFYLSNTTDSVTERKKVKPYICRNKLRQANVHPGFLSTNTLFQGNRLDHGGLSIGITEQSHADLPPEILIITRNLKPSFYFPEGTANFPRKIIVDSSNDRLSIREWEQFCRKKQIILLKSSTEGTIHIPLK